MRVTILIYQYKGNLYLIVQKMIDESDTLEDVEYFHRKGNFSCDCNRSRNIRGFDCPMSIRDMIPAGFMSPSPKIEITCYPDFPVLPCGEEIKLEALEVKHLTEEEILTMIDLFKKCKVPYNLENRYEIEVRPQVMRGGNPT